MEYLGNICQASTLLYLPTPPIVDPQSPCDYNRLCELNGNHWRKILIILAKLQSPDNNWRNYRDNKLLQQQEAISFRDCLEPDKALHIIAGRASWDRLGLDHTGFMPLEDSNRLLLRDNILLAPYPDYRQFPNHLIEMARPVTRSLTSP